MGLGKFLVTTRIVGRRRRDAMERRESILNLWWNDASLVSTSWVSCLDKGDSAKKRESIRLFHSFSKARAFCRIRNIYWDSHQCWLE
jgi:hypothetical protein